MRLLPKLLRPFGTNLLSQITMLKLNSEYKPELEKRAEERKTRIEGDKKNQLDRLMRDMDVSDKTGSGSSQAQRSSRNPFGPRARNEREDR